MSAQTRPAVKSQNPEWVKIHIKGNTWNTDTLPNYSWSYHRLQLHIWRFCLAASHQMGAVTAISGSWSPDAGQVSALFHPPLLRNEEGITWPTSIKASGLATFIETLRPNFPCGLNLNWKQPIQNILYFTYRCTILFTKVKTYFLDLVSIQSIYWWPVNVVVTLFINIDTAFGQKCPLPLFVIVEIELESKVCSDLKAINYCCSSHCWYYQW